MLYYIQFDQLKVRNASIRYAFRDNGFWRYSIYDEETARDLNYEPNTVYYWTCHSDPIPLRDL